MPNLGASVFVSALFLGAFLALVIVLAQVYTPYEVRMSKGHFIFDVVLSTFGGWVSVLAIVLWGLPSPTIDQILPLPAVGMVVGAAVAYYACTHRLGHKIGDKLRHYVQGHTKQT